MKQAVEKFQVILTNMKLKAKTFMKKMQDIVNNPKSDRVKYGQVSKLVLSQVPHQNNLEVIVNKDIIKKVIPILKQIYIDSSTRDLFYLVVANPNAQITYTADFIEFLEKVTEDKKP